MYSITCIQRPPMGNHKSVLLQLVVFKCRVCQVDLRRGVVSEQQSLTAVDCLMQVVSNTGFTVYGAERALSSKGYHTFLLTTYSLVVLNVESWTAEPTITRATAAEVPLHKPETIWLNS